MKKLYKVTLGSLVIAAGMLLFAACESEVKEEGNPGPGAPTVTLSRVGDAQAELEIVKPAKNGGSPLTGYEIQITSPGKKIVIDAGETTGKTIMAKEDDAKGKETASHTVNIDEADLKAESIKVEIKGLPDLGPSKKHSFTVTAIYKDKAKSAATKLDKGPIKPSAPGKIIGATPGSGASGDINLTSIPAPANNEDYRGDGGSQITKYTVTVLPGEGTTDMPEQTTFTLTHESGATTTTPSIDLTATDEQDLKVNLASGTIPAITVKTGKANKKFTFTAVATNEVGDSPASDKSSEITAKP